MTERKRLDNEIGCSASSNGRRITLAPLRTLTLHVPAREVESTLPCGFRAEWASGEHGGSEFMLTSGAGLGSRWMTFRWKDKDYCIDVGDIAEAFITEIKSKGVTK